MSTAEGISFLPCLMYILQTFLGLYVVLFLVGVFTTITEWRIHTTPLRKVLYTVTFPFMLTYIPISMVALFSRKKCSGSPLSTTGRTAGCWKPPPAENNRCHPRRARRGISLSREQDQRGACKDGFERKTLYLVSKPGCEYFPAIKGCGRRSLTACSATPLPCLTAGAAL